MDSVPTKTTRVGTLAAIGETQRTVNDTLPPNLAAVSGRSQMGVGAERGQAHSGHDSLLACLSYIVKANGLPFQATAALSGLPLAPGQQLSAQLLPRAAARCGLKAELVSRLPSSVPALVVPFIVLMHEGEAAVVVAIKRRSKSATVVVPGTSRARRNVRLADLDKHATGEIVLIARNEALEEPASGQAAGRDHWFWAGVWRMWPSWLQVALAAVLINVLGLAVPIFVMSVYDRVIPNQILTTLWALTLGVGLALVFDLLLRQLRAVVLDQAGGLVDMRSASRLFDQALALPMSERQQPTGALANQIREFETVRDFFASSSIVAFTDLLFIGVVLAVMWAIVGQVALVPLAAVPLVVALTLLMQLPLGHAVRITQAQASKRHAVLIESLSGIETVKAVGAESIMQRRWEDAVAASVRASSSTRFWSSLNMNFVSLIQQAVGVAIVVWGVFLSADGQISVGGIIAASMLSGRVLAPLSNIVLTLSRAQASLSAMRGLNALMQRPRESSGTTSGAAIEDDSVEFRRLSFSYPEAPHPSLSDINLRIEPGERVGLVGRVGSGKTTLGKLLDGLWLPDTGTILVGRREVRSLDPAELRAHVGFMAQEIELFSGTLYDNIIMGVRHCEEADVIDVCNVSGVSEFARLHPLGLKLAVGERGRRLSGGQRQAVALARLLVRKPRVLFLDEPSSAMDNASEAELVRRLKDWASSGQTLIISSQRMAMLELCDRLVVLDAGKIVADGPKSDVLRMLAGGGRQSTRVQPAAE